jgi:tellurite resistance protein TehA-like permease
MLDLFDLFDLFDLSALVVGIFYVGIAYRKAKQSGHNPIRWAAIVAGVFLGTLLLVSGSISFIIGFGQGFWWSENVFDDYEIHRFILSLLASIFTTWLVLRFIRKIPDESFDEPPPPPTFESSKN